LISVFGARSVAAGLNHPLLHFNTSHMTHSYKITGMSCEGCREKVEKALNAVDGVTAAVVSKERDSAVVTMETHIPVERLQAALRGAGDYGIGSEVHVDGMPHALSGEMRHGHAPGSGDGHQYPASGAHHHHTLKEPQQAGAGSGGKYYCPMHCEGDKRYDKPGACPVCGMNLEKVPELSVARPQYTCPMHPEVIRDGPGSCPLCGMDLVPAAPGADEDQQTYKRLLKQFKVAVAFTIPVFIISMGG